MKTRHIEIPSEVKEHILSIVNQFRERGYQCYLVGGSVRDLLLGHPVYDYDFATDAHPETVMRMFRRVVPTGIKHGTVSVIMSDDSTYEITTYRSDGAYIDGRRPEQVSFSKTLEEDVLRRDFTINGLAFDVFSAEVIDYVGGLDDIGRRIIRTIGNPVERFSEDGLRTYRACRFASKLGFDIDQDTFNAISRTLDVARKLSVERVRDEFKKILETEKPSVGIELLRKCGLLNLFLPELDECYGMDQNKYHIYDIYHHSLYSCDAVPGDRPLIRLAAILHDIGKAPARREGPDGDYTFYNHEVIGAKLTRRIMKRLRFSNDEIVHVNNLVLNHMFHFTDDWTDGAVRRFMRKVGVENLDDLFLLRIADRKGNGSRDGIPAPLLKLKERIDRIIEEENAITVRDLDIDGHVLMDEFNLAPGPLIGRILNDLLEVVLDDPYANRRDILLERSREILDGIRTAST